MTSRIHRILTKEEILQITNTYHAWRGDNKASNFEDRPGFTKSATLKEIKDHRFVLVPGRYVGFTEELKHWDIDLLKSEFKELEHRVKQSQMMAESALLTLKELIYG